MILPWDKGLSHQRLKLLICTLTLTTKPTLISRRANKNFVLIFLNHRNYWINKNKSHISLKKLVSKYLYKNIKVYKFFCFVLFEACVDPWKHHMHNNTSTGKVATKELDICSSFFFLFTYIHVTIKIILFWLFGGSILQQAKYFF